MHCFYLIKQINESLFNIPIDIDINVAKSNQQYKYNLNNY